ncbi:MAG: hypothetical protein K1060chlam2_00031 [Chlamydiae bacterium]|nr:hypothetical protein [Chlamydiota bacterium]
MPTLSIAINPILELIQKDLLLLWPLHPRTRGAIEKQGESFVENLTAPLIGNH